MKCYLAGGFRSGWQDFVKSEIADWDFLDPSATGHQKPEDYVAWDLGALDGADLVIAYLESGNPGGYALAFETGYAVAKGIPVYLVDEHPNQSRARHFAFIRAAVDHRYNSLGELVDRLKKDPACGRSGSTDR